jgi:hypothetical protein
MSLSTVESRKAGRQYIGPKAQTQVPAEIEREVRAEATRRRCPRSEVWRELIEAGYSVWSARGEE